MIVLHAHITVVPGAEAAFEAVARRLVVATRRAEPGVRRYEYYRLTEPRLIRKGTRLNATATYDNSAANTNNPDPAEAVRYGVQSWDEMMLNYVDVAVPPGAEPWNVLARPVPARRNRERMHGG